ncbi:hypothetical protein INR49_007558 [Caranx melampygus]|nr:hypothetical protein INR49_007572 [Caranx melampygus]KAG7233018.1 hypothetical protein INR49_007558 [Caranx melampygus]
MSCSLFPSVVKESGGKIRGRSSDPPQAREQLIMSYLSQVVCRSAGWQESVVCGESEKSLPQQPPLRERA